VGYVENDQPTGADRYDAVVSAAAAARADPCAAFERR
jgi:hypothetical protein